MKLSELKKIILWLKDETIPLYQATRQEQKLLDIWEINEGITIQGNIELYTNYIVGYASQVAHKGFVGTGTLEEIENALLELHRYSLFQNEHITKWFLLWSNNFKNIQRYLLTIDHLRLLTLEYLKLQKENNI